MYTRSTGWGWYLPAFRTAASTSRNSATPCRSTSSRLTPSTAALPPLVFTSCQARHSTSGRSMRSYRAWNLRSRHFLAARYILRWSCVVSTIPRYVTSSDFSDGVALHFTLRLIAGLTVVVDHRPSETSLVSVPTVVAFRSPYAVESIEVAFQILPLFRGLHQ